MLPHARGAPKVNGEVHSEIAAVPAERLVSEREVLRPVPSGRPPLRAAATRTVDKRGSVRFGSGLYLVPKSLVGECVDVLAHEDKVVIRHAGAEVVRHDPVGPGEVAFGDLGDPERQPTRGIRPRSAAEAATLRLEHELAAIVELVAVYGRESVVSALSRASRFRRFKAADMRA